MVNRKGKTGYRDRKRAKQSKAVTTKERGESERERRTTITLKYNIRVQLREEEVEQAV